MYYKQESSLSKTAYLRELEMEKYTPVAAPSIQPKLDEDAWRAMRRLNFLKNILDLALVPFCILSPLFFSPPEINRIILIQPIILFIGIATGFLPGPINETRCTAYLERLIRSFCTALFGLFCIELLFVIIPTNTPMFAFFAWFLLTLFSTAIAISIAAAILDMRLHYYHKKQPPS